MHCLTLAAWGMRHICWTVRLCIQVVDHFVLLEESLANVSIITHHIFLVRMLNSTFPLAAVTAYANCTDGEVRLANGTTDQVTGIIDGRLEVCFNHAWGTVCQNSFQSSEASVVCSLMGHFTGM